MPKGHSGIKRSTKGGNAQAPAQTTVSVPVAKTIAEAEHLAVDLGLARHADFTDLDVSAANELITQIKATKDLIPDLPEMEIIGGTAAVRFRLGGAYSNGDSYASFLEAAAGPHKG